MGRAVSVALMRAAVLADVGRLEVRDVPLVPPGPGEVLLRVAAVGLCGTDFTSSPATATITPTNTAAQFRSRNRHRFSDTNSSAPSRRPAAVFSISCPGIAWSSIRAGTASAQAAPRMQVALRHRRLASMRLLR